MTVQQNKILEGIKALLRTTLPSHGEALLYGSQARGDNRSDSDWDILILIDKDKVSLVENSAITYPLVLFGWDNGIEINPVLYTKKEWNAYHNTPFYENVTRDGMKIA